MQRGKLKKLLIVVKCDDSFQGEGTQFTEYSVTDDYFATSHFNFIADGVGPSAVTYLVDE